MRHQSAEAGVPAAELRSVGKAYGDVPALAGLDLVLPRGTFLALLGPNGAGKTTAISLLPGLRTPDRGEARLLGGSPVDCDIRRRIGATPQVSAFPPGLRVREIVAFVAAHYAEPLPAEALCEIRFRWDTACPPAGFCARPRVSPTVVPPVPGHTAGLPQYACAPPAFTRGTVESPVHCRFERGATMRTRRLIGALAALLAGAVHAGEGDGDDRSRLQLAVGAKVTSEQSVYVQGDDFVTFLPGAYGLWGRFYVRGPALGVYLLGGGDWTVSTGVSLELGDTDRGDSPQLADMAELDNVLLGEFRVSYDAGWGELLSRVAADISGRHDGFLAGVSYGIPFAVGGWQVEPRVGIEWHGAKVNRYYYGVSAADALPDRPAYRPDAGMSYEFGVSATYTFAQRHTLQLAASMESFDDEVTDSPIVDRSSRRSLGAGYIYSF